MKSEPALERGGNTPSLMSDTTFKGPSFLLFKPLANTAERNWPRTNPAEHAADHNFLSAAFPLGLQKWGLEGVMEMDSLTNYNDMYHKAKRL